MVILGLNIFHGDSAACLVIDGRLICAIEEERIRRIKHWAGFPSESIKWCLSYAGISIKNVDYITVSRNPLARFPKKILRIMIKHPRMSFLDQRLKNYAGLRNIRQILYQTYGMKENEIKAKVIYIEHHFSHLASSFFVSSFDKAAVISIDGFGDFASSMQAVGRGNRLSVISEVIFPHSLGILYTALTQYLGFWNYGDEYKVMGLSAFGKPVYLEKMRKIIKLKRRGLFELDTSYFLHDIMGVEMTWFNEMPKVGRLFSDKLIKLLGPARQEDEELENRYQDICASLQAIYEEAFFHILNEVQRKTHFSSLALSGGCIQNSLANGKIYEMTNFKNVYVPPASHDAGSAIGSAFFLWHQLFKKRRSFVMESSYWGPDFSPDIIKICLDENNLEYEELDEQNLLIMVAKKIADGNIIGWFQGRTEWGPRALGNRSILVDPRRKEMKDILNARIKKREWFRPFAPSVLEENFSEWFENSGTSPFMEKVYKIKAEKMALIPAVCHVDGTARVQTVSKGVNPKYYSLIMEFENLTGVPILLNTSFNENEPIVNTPLDATTCFKKVGMDILIIENIIIAKK